MQKCSAIYFKGPPIEDDIQTPVELDVLLVKVDAKRESEAVTDFFDVPKDDPKVIEKVLRILIQIETTTACLDHDITVAVPLPDALSTPVSTKASTIAPTIKQSIQVPKAQARNIPLPLSPKPRRAKQGVKTKKGT